MYDTLLKSRSLSNGVPHFWKPEPIVASPLCIFSDEDQPIDPSWGVEEAIKKIISLGLFLELPVGEWVQSARRSELQIPDVAKKLLHTNIADEASHDRGFRYAAEVYDVTPYLSEAEKISKVWLDDPSHPMVKACSAETGVFLCSLALLRLAGGQSLARMSEQISRDESRHVATNWLILKDLGYDPTKPSTSISEAITETIDYVFDGVCIPGEEIGEIFAFDKDFMLRSSASLMSTGLAPELDSLMSVATYTPNFESSNSLVYARSAYGSLE